MANESEASLEKDAPSPERVVRLEREVEKVGDISEVEARAKAFVHRISGWSRIIMVVVIGAIFIGLNYAVMSFIRDVFKEDLRLMAASPPLQPSDRLITTHVLMALIGATVVQVGLAIAAIVGNLFPKGNSRLD